MKIFDDVNDVADKLRVTLDSKCPRCGGTLKADNSQYFSMLKCSICDLEIEVTTRNNYRVIYMFMIGAFTFAVGLFLGLL